MTASTTPARSRTARGFHPLTVARVDRLCADAVAVTLTVPSELAETYRFRAGQSLTLRRTVDGREERRSYSVCAAEGEQLRIGVREVPGGVFSTWLVREVQPGDTIDVGAPAGTFTPARHAGRHVLIGAGSGITPLLSIASTVLSDPDATVTLLYGNRRSDTVMFTDELADLKDHRPQRLELVHVLSREPREADLLSGRLDTDKLRALLALVPDPDAVDDWWLCGPYDMVVGAGALLREAGVPAERIHRELFFVDDAPPEPVRHADPATPADACEVTLVLDGRRTTTTVAKDVPVLDGAQRVRPDLPFACKGGVCGTCRARVTEGEVAMRRNFALEDAEVAAGFVLTCQALPVSDSVAVDYDD
ncbi:phenylacetic acid degradation protein [Saccharomonospora sp. CUA-673]|uniref:1,2-phenylacetyl-CoA epoxidase subunit PaaE n=1 Tax=Saccharomonospora sp. CUA-673 TaxID=1904969 RepID=UPI00095ED491|nr:1,2-phenylacetyl-CoA epoxidase subunit PaaE [Saccharomonospora sp. CUA-673]OLT41242.1 phenylacetic acid degradation protein [Saccharomonospora sp. CUA-673]